MFGHCQCRHLQARSLVEELVDTAGTIQQGKLGVTMKVNEVLISHWIWGPVSPKADPEKALITRYYSGVPFRRTTISCVAVAFLIVVACARDASAAVTFPLEAKWSATLPASPAFAPAFDATRIYLPLQTKQLVALMIKDGSVAWSVECPMTTAPAAGDGLVYAGSEDLIEARAEGNGAAQWRRPVQGRVVSLHWDTGWLFAQTEPGVFFAIRAKDGEILWQKDFGSPLSDASRRRLGTVCICRSKTAGLSRSRSRAAMRSGRASSPSRPPAFCLSATASSSERATISFIR